MKVLYLSNQPRFLGGAERSLYELLKNLDRSRVQPFFASIYEEEVCQAIQRLGIPFLKLKPFSRKNFFPLIENTISLIRFIRQNRIEIIHNNQCVDAYYSLLAGKCTHTPVIIHHRDSKYYRLDRLVIRLAEYQISTSTWQNRLFFQNQAILIHNGIEMNSFPPMIESHPILDETVKIGIIGRIAPLKNQDVFILAARYVINRKNNVRFKIIGDIDTSPYQEYKKYLRSLVQEQGVSNWVEFCGYIPNVVEALSQIDILVSASQRESFGRVLVEAMACGKPVIGTNVWGAVDIVTPECGLLVPPNDPQSLGEAILTLANNPEMRERMGKAGRARVEQNFTIQHTLEKIYALYEQILNHSH
ncbi:glycosyltransferase family 4 protein [Anaerolinea sp.]|uniref:glycosyltransferase family 4 protein n=1 Tax=Anaerolinea sp. TaxID=1872519 RepID=UPI003A100A20